VAVKREERLVRLAQAENTFEIVARQWYEHWKGPKNARHAGYVLSRLEADVFPAIGSRPIAEILAPELVAMVKTIEKRGALDIAKRCLQMTGQVFRYAIAHGVGGATRNPATDIKPTDVLTPRTKENYARIDARELPELLRKIEAYQGTPITRLAIKLMALTFVRTGELIGARWAEFNLDAARWDIPASRMKMKTPHVVPLCSQAIEVLRVLHTATGGRELLFPGERDHAKPMSNNTILGALDRMGYKGKMTGHGFRGVASTILHEHGFDHMHIELQLAHIERNAVSAAYNHALYLDQRAKMMAWWGNYLDSLTRSNVLPLRSLAA
jgi:integrase